MGCNQRPLNGPKHVLNFADQTISPSLLLKWMPLPVRARVRRLLPGRAGIGQFENSCARATSCLPPITVKTRLRPFCCSCYGAVVPAASRQCRLSAVLALGFMHGHYWSSPGLIWRSTQSRTSCSGWRISATAIPHLIVTFYGTKWSPC